jgi:hypothetical protein
MGSSRIPGPIGSDAHLANSDGKSWCDVGCKGGHTPGPIRVAGADAPMDKSKKPTQPSSTPTQPSSTPTKASSRPTKGTTIIWHIYAPMYKGTATHTPYSTQDFINWFNAPDDTEHPDVTKWSAEDIYPEFKTKTNSGVHDFEQSLQTKGAIVVYIGHSTLSPRQTKDGPLGPSQGLSPDDPAKGPEIPNDKLRALLRRSTASLVIIGSCDSKTAVGNISGGPPIIVANSGSDHETWLDHMARAAAIVLFLLIGWEMEDRQPKKRHTDVNGKPARGTINEAVAASAAAFTDIPDRFELAHGDGSIKLFP